MDEIIATETLTDWSAIPVGDKLEILASMKDERTVRTMDLDRQIADLQARKEALVGDLDESIAACETSIRFDVLRAGATAKGSRLMAVWNKGRVSWDTKRLDGYAVAHPEIAAFRTEGEPSVTIRVSGRA